MSEIIQIQEDAQKRQQEVLDLIEALADTSSDGVSTVRKPIKCRIRR
jgi:hypothetical protein